jgi:hypothetical protein
LRKGTIEGTSLHATPRQSKDANATVQRVPFGLGKVGVIVLTVEASDLIARLSSVTELTRQNIDASVAPKI